MREPLYPLAQTLITKMQEKKLFLTVAESCTGGLLAGAITAIPGASAILECGFVTYSNASKTRLLGVDPTLLTTYGAVSSEVAASMAEGALRTSQADIALSITGIAGPGGGSAEKPVGCIFLGLAQKQHPCQTKQLQLTGTREEIRYHTVEEALRWVIDTLSFG